MATPDMETLLQAQQIAAQLVARDGPAFLPVFERLEAEMKAARAREASVERARAMAEGGRAPC